MRKTEPFVRRERRKGETVDRKVCFRQSSPCRACLVSDLNAVMDLSLS